MRLGDVAKALGVHCDTLRRLERQGVFTARRDWRGHRRFTESDLAQLRTIIFPPVGKPEPQRGLEALGHLSKKPRRLTPTGAKETSNTP